MASLFMPPTPAVPCECREHESLPDSSSEPLRRYAPEEFRHSIPQRVVCRSVGENNCLRRCFTNNFAPVRKTTVFILKTIVYRPCEGIMTITQNTSRSMDVRLARSTGRTGRDRMANARVTAEEQRELHNAARAQGKSLSEWAREVLLREARRSDHDAVFTEIVATRMLLVNLIKPLILGKPVTSQWITEAMTAVRREKRRAAQEVLQQYSDDAKGDR